MNFKAVSISACKDKHIYIIIIKRVNKRPLYVHELSFFFDGNE